MRNFQNAMRRLKPDLCVETIERRYPRYLGIGFCGQTHFRRDFFAVSRSGPISIYSKAWYGIDVDDYAIVRIEGHPAKKLYFWIERADFVRQYQKIGPFWLPQRDETFVQVRLYGKHVLSIDHQNYTVDQAVEDSPMR